MGREELQRMIAGSSLFCGCELPSDSVLIKICRKGQIVSDRQKGQEFVGLIVRGSVDVYSIAMDGREIVLSRLEAGDCFGVINLLAGAELPTVLKCRSETKLLLIPKRLFIQAMQDDPALALRYAGFCNRKMQFLIKRIEFLTMQSGRNKLIQYLLMRQDEDGCVRLDCSKEDFAAVLGISRASMFRELAALQEQGFICRNPGQIRILERARLEDILYETV